MRELLNRTFTVGGMTLLSRILGFVRDVVVARIFGAGPITDAFFVAFRVPNLLRRWFAEGAFSLAFIPVLGEHKNDPQPQIKEIIGAIAGTLGLLVSIIVALGMVFAPVVVNGFAFGFSDDPQLFDLTSNMLRITFPYALFITLAAAAGSVLNTWGRFAMPAFSPVLLNLSMIVGALFAAPYFNEPIVALAWAVCIAGFLQLVLQLPTLVRMGLFPRLSVRPNHPTVRKVGRLMLPALFGSSVAQLNILVDTLLASMLAAGSISWLYYSDRLLEFPLGVFAIAIATVILPKLSSDHASKDGAQFAATLDWAIRLATVIAIPAAAGLFLLALPIASTLFQQGEFGVADSAMVASSLSAYAFGLPAYIAIKILAPAYYSRQDTKTPVKIGILAMVSNMVFNLILLWVFHRFTQIPLHTALALASTFSAYLNAILLYIGLRRRQLHRFGGQWKSLSVSLVLGMTLMCSLIAFLTRSSPWWTQQPQFDRAWHLAIVIGTAGLAYVAIFILTGVWRQFAQRG